MKAFAVVRKSPPTTVQHILKVKRQNPHVAIQPIQQNETASIRRDNREVLVHSLERKSGHLVIEPSGKDATQFNVSLSRRNKIFDQYETSRSKQKRAKLQNSLSESVKNKQKVEANALPLLSELISRESEKKERTRLKSERQSIAATPEKKKQSQQLSTPFEILKRSSRQRQKTGELHYQSLQIYQRQNEQSLHSREMTRSIPTRDIEARNPIFQREKVKSNTSNILQPKRAPFIQRISHIRNQPQDSDNISEGSESVVNIGCCGQPLETEPTNKKGKSTYRTAYDRATTQFHVNNSINEVNNFCIVESIDRSYQQLKHEDQPRPFHRKIFGEFNPQSQSSKIREELSYKKDKISSKPALPLQQSSKYNKAHRVTVYEIRTFEPFEF